MKAPPKYMLPLVEALGGVADALEAGRSAEPSLSRVMAMLAIRPADSVSSIRSEIQYYARLWPRAGAYDLSAKRVPPWRYYGDMIARNPDLKYLFLFHQDGHARQVALDAIIGPPPAPFFLSSIMPRLNDWVPEVRQGAAACFERVVPQCEPETMFQVVLGTFYQSRNWARWTSQSSSLLLHLLQQPSMTERIVDWLGRAHGGRLSSMMRTLLQRPMIDTHLYDLARNAASPSVRGRALRVLLDGQADWTEFVPQTAAWRPPPPPVLKTRALSVASPPLQDLVDLGLSDKSALVRKVVGRVIVARARELEKLDAVIDSLLADPVASIRWRGEFLHRTMRGAAANRAGPWVIQGPSETLGVNPRLS